MIDYSKGAFGLNLLIRVHGSAVYKAIIPGMISVIIFLLIRECYTPKDGEDNLRHPYAVGVLVSSVSFIIIFRANYGYQRYWEACGAVHQMMSKWLDAAVHSTVFHLQCSHYKDIKPPTFTDHPELIGKKLCRDRNRAGIGSIEKMRSRLTVSRSVKRLSLMLPANEASTNFASIEMTPQSTVQEDESVTSGRLYGRNRVDGGWGLLCPKHKWASPESWASNRTPSLLLQELAHLASLTLAVAFSTLRNDIEGGESPLDVYIPEDPWPEADSDKMTVKENEGTRTQDRLIRKLWRNFSYWIGMDRTPALRTLYNASRPMLVIGGVSDGEIEMLQRARGPYAKTTLAAMWYTEFMTREHIAGGINIAPPIFSRIIQFVSDGMIFYNHARKIMYIPFPFPHAQMSALFVLVIILAVPFLMEDYADNKAIGCLLTFATVTCLAGLHEVARELENPFRNAPNDIPLCTLLAMFNDSLLAMCSGYHPDSFWKSGIPVDV